MAESRKARAYEEMYPGTGISEAQKEERFERRAFEAERSSLSRTTRTRGVVIPELPWKKENE